jgi:imidazolonepropionase-like amidohydrolase/Tol biopolymer transport system component
MRTSTILALAFLFCAPLALSAQSPDASQTALSARHASGSTGSALPVFGDSIPVRVSEGTGLHIDLTHDGRSLVIDLLGQLWLVPAEGGEARLVAGRLMIEADDRQPAISPDGRWVATRSDRPAGRGIWLHSLTGEQPRQLTDSALILGGDVGVPSWSPSGDRLAFAARGAVVLLELAIGRSDTLRAAGLENAPLDEPAWSPDGRKLLVSGPWRGGAARPLLEGAPGAGIWEVDVASGTARRLTAESEAARAPAYSPTGERLAYFSADSSAHYRLVVQPLDGEPFTVTSEAGIEPHRVRWSPDGGSLWYVARGRMRRVALAGGPPTEIPFTAELVLPKATYVRRAPPLPMAGAIDSARGFSGLALAPDGSRIGMLALGRLWLIGMDRQARAVARVPVSANGLAWSPDGRRVAWTAGPVGAQDLWLTDLATGAHVRVSRSAGSDARAAWSPDGRWLAFLHNDGRIHLVNGDARNDSTENLGPVVPFSEIAAFSETMEWLPAGDTLLVYGMGAWPVASRECVQALLPLRGEPRPVAPSLRPAHVRLGATALRGHRARRAHRTAADGGRLGGATPRGPRGGTAPIARPRWSDAVRIGRRLARAERNDRELRLGWRFALVPLPPPLLLRNVRLVPLDSASPDTAPRDLLLLAGRIAEVAPAGARRLGQRLPAGTHVLDAAGRWAIPGLIDAHTHFLGTGIASVRAALYHGVTTVREMWHPLAESAAFRDDVASGAVTGARIVVSGPPFYPATTIPPVTSDFLWIPTDSATGERGLELLRAFGAGHVKLRYTQSWSAAADFLQRAHSFGFPAGGHCAHGLALVAAGIDTHEHADGQCGDWQFGIHEDIAALYRAAGVTVVPVIDVHDEVARAARDTMRLHSPVMLAFRGGVAAVQVSPPALRRLEARAARARAHTRLLHDHGVPLAAGADAEDFPGGMPRELEALVAAGLSPAEALRAATSQAAALLGLGHELGRLVPGQRADLLLLDGDPLADIRNTARIHRIIQDGRIIARDQLLWPDH